MPGLSFRDLGVAGDGMQLAQTEFRKTTRPVGIRFRKLASRPDWKASKLVRGIVGAPDGATVEVEGRDVQRRSSLLRPGLSFGEAKNEEQGTEVISLLGSSLAGEFSTSNRRNSRLG